MQLKLVFLPMYFETENKLFILEFCLTDSSGKKRTAECLRILRFKTLRIVAQNVPILAELTEFSTCEQLVTFYQFKIFFDLHLKIQWLHM